MLAHIGYDRYFDFDEIVVIINSRAGDLRINGKRKNLFKKDLIDHIPHVVGKNRRIWYKETDLIPGLEAMFPGCDFRSAFGSYKIRESIVRFSDEGQIIQYHAELYMRLAELYKRLLSLEDDANKVWMEIEETAQTIYTLRSYLPGNYRHAELDYVCPKNQDEREAELLKKFKWTSYMLDKYADETEEILMK